MNKPTKVVVGTVVAAGVLSLLMALAMAMG